MAEKNIGVDEPHPEGEGSRLGGFRSLRGAAARARERVDAVAASAGDGIGGLQSKTQESLGSLKSGVDGVRDSVSSQVGKVADVIAKVAGAPPVSWEQALEVSQPPLTGGDLDEICTSIPRGDGTVHGESSGGWPGKLRVWRQDGENRAYVHRVKRGVKRTAGEKLTVGGTYAVLGLSVLSGNWLLAEQVPQHGVRTWYDAFLHDENGRLLLAAHGADDRNPLDVDVFVPDGSLIAQVRRSTSEAGRDIRGYGPLDGLVLTTLNTSVEWFGISAMPNGWSWRDTDGASVVQIRGRINSTIHIVDRPLVSVLAASAALWWWTQDDGIATE